MKKNYFLYFIAFLFIGTCWGQAVFINVNESYGPENLATATIDIPGYGSSADIIMLSSSDVLTITGEVGSTEILGTIPGSGSLANIYSTSVSISNTSDSGANDVYDDTNGLYMFDAFGAAGNWIDVNPAEYIGFRIVDGGGYHYGWIEITTSTSGGVNWTIERFGWEQTIDTAILTGAGVLSIEKESFYDKVLITTKNNYINIFHLPENSNYSIFSILGREVKSGVVQRDRNYIVTDNLTSGMYVIKLEGKETGSSITRKIIL